MQKEQFLDILKKYDGGNATTEEVEFLRTYYNLFELEPEVLNSLKSNEKAGIKDRIESRLMEHIGNLEQTGKKKNYRWVAAAASILLILSIGGYFLLPRQQPAQTLVHNQPQDIAPGSNRATLTLANGQKIILTKGLMGKLAQQGNTSIQVNGGNAITYNAAGNAITAAPVAYNTLSTVRGEQSPYPLVLADGTRIWLNAASSITFPTAFMGKERKVTVTGEAYFEVMHNAAQPFSVNVNGHTIEDIGTHFNISAYDDEPAMRTTLLEGAVRVRLNQQNTEALLKPGQQAVIPAGKNTIRTKVVDVDEVMAWKNGYFDFDDENLEGVMRKISRWYDVDIVYADNNLKTQVFGGTVSRFKTVSQVLKKLALTNTVHFKIEGKKITVIP